MRVPLGFRAWGTGVALATLLASCSLPGGAPSAPEIADIGMMQTKTLTYTFSGPGPFGFACHVAGHFEAGMQGTITVLQ